MASRQKIYDALIEHAKGHIAKHPVNVQDIHGKGCSALVNILIY